MATHLTRDIVILCVSHIHEICCINGGHGTAVSLQLMGYGHSKSRVLGMIPMQPETI